MDEEENTTVLVMGGAGFRGVFTLIRLLDEGYRVTVIDKFDQEPSTRCGDLRKYDDLEKLFSLLKFDGVIHFAGHKAVGESMEHPLRYFDSNLVGTINLYKVMEKYDCKKMVFSSSCTVYGEPDKVPVDENTPLRPVNPYGRTKMYLEEIARDLHKADPEWKIIQLRYFNPVGAYDRGIMGEHPKGTPNNLFPCMGLVANEKMEELNVYGNDYPTPDGTAYMIRDYINVMDLADGHIAALGKLFEEYIKDAPSTIWELAMVHLCFKWLLHLRELVARNFPIKMCPRRPGDAAVIYGNCEKAEKELGWKATRDIDKICEDQWQWVHRYRNGYYHPIYR